MTIREVVDDLFGEFLFILIQHEILLFFFFFFFYMHNTVNDILNLINLPYFQITDFIESLSVFISH